MGYGIWGEHTSWVGWLGTGLTMLVFWGLIAAVIVWMVRTDGSGRGPRLVDRPPGLDAQRILAERFARSELTEEEYARRRDLLRRGD